MAKISNKPSIRFKGFTDAWEQRKLSVLCEKFTDGDWIEAKDQSNSGVRLIQTGNIGLGEYLDKPNNKKWISEDTFNRLHCEEVCPGDILISRLPEPAGRACIMPNLGVKMITAVDCTIVRVAAGISKEFLLQHLSSPKHFNEVNTCMAGGTRQRISRSNLANFGVLIPTLFEEQELIGGFLCGIDNLITLHQRKYEKFVNIKKALLEKMFPQGDEKVPRIRFRGFTDAWEQRKLGAMAYRVNEMSAIEGLPRVEYEDIEAGQGTLNKNLKEKVSNKKGILFQHSDILYGKLRPYLKNWLFADFFGIAVGDFWVLRSNSVAHSFIYRLLQTPAFDYVANQSSGSKMPRADWKLVSNTEFSFPVSTEEQEKIGLLFLKLDNLITLHQRQVEKLKNIKSALLEKMFV